MDVERQRFGEPRSAGRRSGRSVRAIRGERRRRSQRRDRVVPFLPVGQSAVQQSTDATIAGRSQTVQVIFEDHTAWGYRKPIAVGLFTNAPSNTRQWP